MAMTREDIEAADQKGLLRPGEKEGLLSSIGEAIGEFFSGAMATPDQTTSADIGVRSQPAGDLFPGEAPAQPPDEEGGVLSAAGDALRQGFSAATIPVSDVAPRTALGGRIEGAPVAEGFATEDAAIRKQAEDAEKAAGGIVLATDAPSVRPEEQVAAPVAPEVAAAQEPPVGAEKIVAEPGPPRVGGLTLEEYDAKIKEILTGTDPPEVKVTAIDELQKSLELRQAQKEADKAASAEFVTGLKTAQTTGVEASAARRENERLRQEERRKRDVSFLEEDEQIRAEQNRRRQEARTAVQDVRTAEGKAIEAGTDLFNKFEELDTEITDDLKKLKQVDYWEDKSTGDRILAAISLFLGGFGAALAGTPNFALQIIENEIARDVARQKEEFDRLAQTQERLRGGYAIRANRNRDLLDEYQRREGRIYGDLGNNLALAESLRIFTPELRAIQRSRDADDQIIDASVEADAWKVVANTMEVLKATQMGEQQQRQHALLEQEVNVKLAEKKDALALVVQRIAQDDRNRRAQAFVGFHNQLQENERSENVLEGQRERALLSAGVQIRGQDIKSEAAIAKRIAIASDPLGNMPVTAKIQIADLDSLDLNLNELEENFKKETGPFSILTQLIPGTSANIFNKRQQLFVTEFLKAMQGSRPSDFDMKRYEELIPKAMSLDWKAEAIFEQLRTQLKNRKQALINAFAVGGKAGMDAQQKAWEADSNIKVKLDDGTEGFISNGAAQLNLEQFQFAPDAQPEQPPQGLEGLPTFDISGGG